MTMMTLKIDIGQHRYHKIIVTAVIIVTLSHKNILGGFKNMKFIDNKHKEFWNNKYKEMEQMGKTDVYYKAIVYTLGICETTRDNFSKIFNLRTGEINIDSINGAYQTRDRKSVV